jgi:hypothetical protein
MVVLSTAALAALGCAVEEGSEGPYDEGSFAAKAGAHFVGDATCVESGDSLTCSGSIAGLGNRAVTVSVDVTRICTNRGGNDPPGQVAGTSGPIAPENGRINFSVTVEDDCPDRMASTFLSPATVTVLQGNTEVFTGQIFF